MKNIFPLVVDSDPASELVSTQKTGFPYVPGLLTFRDMRLYIKKSIVHKILSALKLKPGLIHQGGTHAMLSLWS